MRDRYSARVSRSRASSPLLVIFARVLRRRALLPLRCAWSSTPASRAPWRSLALRRGRRCSGPRSSREPIAGRRLRRRASRASSPGPRRSGWASPSWLLLLLRAPATSRSGCSGSPALAATADPAPRARSPGARAVVVLARALLLGAAGMASALRPPRLRRVRFEIEGWPRALDGFRIVQLSDIHFGPILGRALRASIWSSASTRSRPIWWPSPGDLVDGDARLLADEVAPLAGLRARHGVYFVTGNHDHYSGASAWAARAASSACACCATSASRSARARRASTSSASTTTTRLRGRRRRGPRARARGSRPQPPGDAARARSDHLPRARAAPGIDLQLSGHTHGGQIWPFRFAVRLADALGGGRAPRRPRAALREPRHRLLGSAACGCSRRPRSPRSRSTVPRSLTRQGRDPGPLEHERQPRPTRRRQNAPDASLHRAQHTPGPSRARPSGSPRRALSRQCAALSGRWWGGQVPSQVPEDAQASRWGAMRGTRGGHRGRIGIPRAQVPVDSSLSNYPGGPAGGRVRRAAASNRYRLPLDSPHIGSSRRPIPPIPDLEQGALASRASRRPRCRSCFPSKYRRSRGKPRCLGSRCRSRALTRRGSCQ